jgi:hypothetical protein
MRRYEEVAVPTEELRDLLNCGYNIPFELRKEIMDLAERIAEAAKWEAEIEASQEAAGASL